MGESESQRLGRWFDAHAARLVLYARNWLDRAAAEDVVQDVFLRLLSASVNPASEKAWLFTAVRNAAIGEQRSQLRRGRREEAVGQARSSWFESLPGDLIDARAAEEALGNIPPAQREVILLRLWGGLTLAEISAITSEPISTLFSRYRAGLVEIRQALEMSCKMKMT